MYEPRNDNAYPKLERYGMYHQYHTAESDDGAIQPHGGILPNA